MLNVVRLLIEYGADTEQTTFEGARGVWKGSFGDVWGGEKREKLSSSKNLFYLTFNPLFHQQTLHYNTTGHTTPHYHTTLPHHTGNTIPHHYTTPHNHTTPHYYTTLPHHTTPYHTTLPHQTTTPHYHTIPHYHTTQATPACTWPV